MELETAWTSSSREASRKNRPKGDSLTAGQERSVNAIVAIALQLAVDLWRLFTGQTAEDKLVLIYLPDAA